VHPSAIVDPSAKLAKGVAIGPLCIVGPGTTIADGTVLVARVTIGRDVRIGRAGVLHPGVTVHDRCVIGERCVLKSGAVIGAEGFGFTTSPDEGALVKIPHAGTVQIGDDVEIGANSCVDRAKIGATTIGSGTKLDNLVQIGHGAQIGRNCMLCGQCGISGSTVIGDGCMLGGQVGVVDNLTVYPGTKVAAQSGINQQPEGPGDLAGYPARPARQGAKIWMSLDRLPELLARVRELERRLADRDGPGGSGATR
jgi:UDP-3-O-[3-hydroxymyristoyl] glucosamine N-acyltransferase